MNLRINMKSRLIERIQQRYRELSEAGVVLDGDQLRRIRNLPLLHLMKLADALDAETIGIATQALWPSGVVETILLSSGTDN